MLLFVLLVTCISAAQPQNCISTQITRSKFDNAVILAHITCRNIPSNFIITKYHFGEQPYPQDVTIQESKIPVLSNYSSLLNMRFVRKLELKGLGIKTIVPGAFKNMNSLEELDLSDNEISKVSEGVFTGLESLVKLNLQGNNISGGLKEVLGGLPKLAEVDVSGNPVEVSEGDLGGEVKIIKNL